MEARLDAVLSRYQDEPHTRLLRFMDVIRHQGRISINMRPTVLLSFLTLWRSREVTQECSAEVIHAGNGIGAGVYNIIHAEGVQGGD